jgi:hypothetical protein
MYAAGILTGDQNGCFNPENEITRSEAATVILRAYDTKIRVLPFGIDGSLESALSDGGVVFFYVAGTKYKVKSLEVVSASANGVALIATSGNTHQAYQDLINTNSRASSAYGAVSEPDAFVRFRWDGDSILSLSENYVTAEGGKLCPVVDFVFNLNVMLADGSVLPFAYSASTTSPNTSASVSHDPEDRLYVLLAGALALGFSWAPVPSIRSAAVPAPHTPGRAGERPSALIALEARDLRLPLPNSLEAWTRPMPPGTVHGAEY